MGMESLQVAGAGCAGELVEGCQSYLGIPEPGQRPGRVAQLGILEVEGGKRGANQAQEAANLLDALAQVMHAGRGRGPVPIQMGDRGAQLEPGDPAQG